MKGKLTHIALGIFIPVLIIFPVSLHAQTSDPDDITPRKRAQIFKLNIPADEFVKMRDNPVDAMEWEAHPVGDTGGEFVGVRIMVEGVQNQLPRPIMPVGARFLPPAKPGGPNRIYFTELDLQKIADGNVSFGVAIPEKNRDNEHFQIFYRPTQGFLRDRQNSLAAIKPSDNAYDVNNETFSPATGRTPTSASDDSQSTFHSALDRNPADNVRRRTDSNPAWKIPDLQKPRVDTSSWPSDTTRRNPSDPRSSDRIRDRSTSLPSSTFGSSRTNDPNFGSTPVERRIEGPLAPITNSEKTPDLWQQNFAELEAKERRLKEQQQQYAQQQEEKRKREEYMARIKALAQKEAAFEQQKIRTDLERSRIRNSGYDTGISPNNDSPQSVTGTRDQYTQQYGDFVNQYLNKPKSPPSNRLASLNSMPEQTNPVNFETPELPQIKETQTRTEKPKDAQTPNGTSARNQSDQMNFLLLLMFLGSVGLNVFLGWISRGFYVRYNDLADELRQTFNAVSGN